MALDVSRGQYVAASSPVHRLDPRVKLVATLAYTASCLMVAGAAGLALAAIALAAWAAASRIRPRLLLRPLKMLAIFLVVTAIINLFCIPGGAVLWQAGPLSIHAHGARTAVLYSARFFLMLVAGSILMRTTTTTALADALRALLSPLDRFGLDSGQAALTASIALRFVPLLSDEARGIVAAQTARGARWDDLGPIAYARAFVPLMVPLFASALRHAEQLGRAMEARAYAGGRARTHLHPLRFVPRRDGTFCALACLYLIALAALAGA